MEILAFVYYFIEAIATGKQITSTFKSSREFNYKLKIIIVNN